LDEKCQKIEVLQSRFDEFNEHRKVKEVTGKFKKKNVEKLVNDVGEVIVECDEVIVEKPEEFRMYSIRH